MEPHLSLNYFKSVVTCKDLLHIILEEIKTQLSEQSVINVARIMQTVSSKKDPIALLVLTCWVSYVGTKTYAGYQQLILRPYDPKPCCCLKCSCFGHVSSTCKKLEIYCQCGLNTEGSRNGANCPNCGGDHSALSFNCIRYKE